MALPAIRRTQTAKEPTKPRAVRAVGSPRLQSWEDVTAQIPSRPAQCNDCGKHYAVLPFEIGEDETVNGYEFFMGDWWRTDRLEGMLSDIDMTREEYKAEHGE